MTDMLQTLSFGSQSDPIRTQTGHKQDGGGHNVKLKASKQQSTNHWVMFTGAWTSMLARNLRGMNWGYLIYFLSHILIKLSKLHSDIRVQVGCDGQVTQHMSYCSTRLCVCVADGDSREEIAILVNDRARAEEIARTERKRHEIRLEGENTGSVLLREKDGEEGASLAAEWNVFCRGSSAPKAQTSLCVCVCVCVCLCICVCGHRFATPHLKNLKCKFIFGSANSNEAF